MFPIVSQDRSSPVEGVIHVSCCVSGPQLFSWRSDSRFLLCLRTAALQLEERFTFPVVSQDRSSSVEGVIHVSCCVSGLQLFSWRSDSRFLLCLRTAALQLEEESGQRQAEEQAWYRQRELLLHTEQQRKKLIAEEERKLISQRSR